MKKILIIYASAGDGHKKAAEALYDAFLESNGPDIKAVPIDSLNYTSRFFKKSYKIGYMIMIRYLPSVWGVFYYLLDNQFFYRLIRPFRRMLNELNTGRLVGFLHKEKFDIAVSTHFLGTEVIAHLNAKGKLYLPLINVITDFKPHRFWQAKGVAAYVVAQESTKRALIRRGVGNDIIKVCGIPLRKRFSTALSKEKARNQLKLYPDKFTIFVMGGGFGVGPIRETVLKLQRLDFDCQVIVVCGHNKRLFKKLNLLKGEFVKPTFIVGFSADIDKQMAASDVMITKLGGITVSEALAKGLPLLCINPIPGQEARNGEFLLENNVGFNLKDSEEVNRLLGSFYHFPKRQELLRKNIQKLGRPYAARDIACLAMEMIG